MKNELNRMKNALNSPVFKKYVYKYMEELQSDSSKFYGIFAGQALASMAIEFLKISNINVVYNDLDIFRFIDRYEISKETNFCKNIELSRNGRNEKFFGVQSMDVDFNHIVTDISISNISSNYGVYSRELIKTTGMHIMHTMRKDLVNYVFLSYYVESISSILNYKMYKLIDSFDINSTQIGLDLKTGELYFTEDFILFLYTKQLEICRFSTPAHSLIRAFKKAEELNVFFDKNEALSVYALQSAIVKKMHRKFSYYINNTEDNSSLLTMNRKMTKEERVIHLKNNGSEIRNLFFGKDHLKKVQDFDLINHIKLQKKVNSSLQVGSDQEFIVEDSVNYDSFYIMNVNNEERMVTDCLHSLLECNVIKNNQDSELANLIYRNVNNTLSYLNKKVEEMDLGYNPINYSAISKLDTFMLMYKPLKKQLNNIRSKKTYDFINSVSSYNSFNLNLDSNFNSINLAYNEKLISLGKKHKEIFNYMEVISLENVEYVYKVFKKLELNLGQFVYALLPNSEKNRKAIWNINKSNYLESYEIMKLELNKMLKEAKTPFKKDVFIYNSNKFNILELNTGLELMEEGDKQSSCVGGYVVAAKEGKCSILSIRYKDKKRITVSIDKISFYLSKSKELTNRIMKESGKSYSINSNLLEKECELITNIYSFDQVKDYGNGKTSFLSKIEPLEIIANHFKISIDKDEILESNDYSINAEEYLLNYAKTIITDLDYDLGDYDIICNNNSNLFVIDTKGKNLKEYLNNKEYLNKDFSLDVDEDQLPF